MKTSDDLLHLANDLRIACQHVSRRVRFESTSEVAPHQISALMGLRDQARTPGELAEIEKVSAPSMTRTVNCLVERGLVAREDHPGDGRQKLLSLTDEGRATLERTRQARDDWMVRHLEGLDEDERALLRQAADLLTRVILR